MNELIKLTDKFGNECVINVGNVVSINHSNSGACINYANKDFTIVTQSVQEILKLILEERKHNDDNRRVSALNWNK